MTKIRANGIEIEYEDIGPRDGVPLLFINGFGTQMTGWPDEFRDGLARAGLRYIRFDNRDVGLTQKWTGQIPDLKAIGEALREGRKPDIPYTLDDMAADAAGLLDALGIESAHISGASMGGMIAQLVALNHPQKARSLISIFSTTSDRSLPPSTPEAQAALVTRPPSPDRDAVVAHSLKGRRAYASTRWPFDEARLSALVGREFRPLLLSRRHLAAMGGDPRRAAANGAAEIAQDPVARPARFGRHADPAGSRASHGAVHPRRGVSRDRRLGPRHAAGGNPRRAGLYPAIRRTRRDRAQARGLDIALPSCFDGLSMRECESSDPHPEPVEG